MHPICLYRPNISLEGNTETDCASNRFFCIHVTIVLPNETLISLSTTKVINLKEFEQDMKVELLEPDGTLREWCVCKKRNSNRLRRHPMRIKHIHDPLGNVTIQTV